MRRRWSLAVVVAVIVCGVLVSDVPARASRHIDETRKGLSFSHEMILKRGPSALSKRISVSDNASPYYGQAANRYTSIAVWSEAAGRCVFVDKECAWPKNGAGLRNQFSLADFSVARVCMRGHFGKWPRPNFYIIRRGLSAIVDLADMLVLAANLEVSDAMVFGGDIRSELSFCSISGNLIGLSHRFGRFAGIFDRLPGKNDLPKQQGGSDDPDPDAPLCPKCAILGGVGRAPLSAKIAFSLPFWLVAWGAILEGLGLGISRRRSFNPFWLFSVIAVGLIPLLVGIV